MGDASVDPMESARYMAEISNRMQVPDRIMVSGDEQGGAPSPSRASGEGKYNDLGMRQRDPRIDMQVANGPLPSISTWYISIIHTFF